MTRKTINGHRFLVWQGNNIADESLPRPWFWQYDGDRLAVGSIVTSKPQPDQAAAIADARRWLERVTRWR